MLLFKINIFQKEYLFYYDGKSRKIILYFKISTFMREINYFVLVRAQS